MSAPLVSVVMSVYNGQEFLSEAIESILSQTLRDFEFVIIDDGSTDATAKILSTYAQQDNRVKVLRHENRGRAESLNIGISLASGKYIARMDADDIALASRFKEQMEFMERHPEVGLLSGSYELMDREGRLLDTVRLPLRDAEIRSMMLSNNAMCHPAVMMRKDVAVLSGGYRKALLDADDYDLWLRMSERTQMANLEQPLLRYRIHADQASTQNSSHQRLCVLAASAAARHRKQGRPDPLSDVEEITPEVVSRLGVTAAEIEKTLLDSYRHRMQFLDGRDPEPLLSAIEGFLQVSDSGRVGRAERANAWLQAAGIHYRQGRPVKALLSMGRAVRTRPIVAGRPFKRAFARLAGALGFAKQG